MMRLDQHKIKLKGPSSQVWGTCLMVVTFRLLQWNWKYGLRSVSRGMDHATLVDNNKGAISVIKENVKSLKAEKETKIICGNIFSVLERLTLKYDVVYIDPPYAKQENEKLIQKLEDLDIVKSDGVIVVESLQEEVWPEKIASFIKYKEKTYGITRISYYQKEEN